MRELGNPSMTGQAWRLGRLDLARNGLSDDNIAGILERMRQWGLRLRRLNLDENCAAAKGATALVEYVWNCPEALLEIGLADNMVAVNASQDADDPFSALVRCLYNHPGYPYRSQMENGTQIFPLILRLGGNNIVGGRELLRRIQSQGGAAHMRFCSSPDGYVGANDEYLSVFLPDFDRQRTATPPAMTAGVGAEVATQIARPAETPQAPIVAAPATQVQADNHAMQEDRGRPQAHQEPAPAEQAPPPAAQPDPSDADDESYSDEEEEEEEEEEEDSEEYSEEEEEEGQAPPQEPAPQDQGQEPVADSVAAAVVEAAFPVEPEASATSGSKAAYPNPALEMPSLPSTDLSDIPLALKLEMEKDLESDASRSSGAADDGAPAAQAADGQADSAAQAGQTAKIKVKRRKLRKVKKGGKGKPKPFGALQTGDTADGKITLVKEKFVMVDFGAEVEGMLYVTNMSKRGRVREMFEVGDPVNAQVCGLCTRRMRVSLQQRREIVVLKSNVEVMQDKAAMAEGIPPGMPRPKRRPKALEDGADGAKSGNNVHKGEGGESSLLEIVDESLTAEEQKLLQSDIIDYLENTPDLSSDGLPLEEVKEDIAELAVCCLMTKMKTPIVESELSPYLNDHTSSFVSWLAAHLRGPWLRKRRERAGATPKAGAARNKRTS